MGMRLFGFTLPSMMRRQFYDKKRTPLSGRRFKESFPMHVPGIECREFITKPFCITDVAINQGALYHAMCCTLTRMTGFMSRNI